MEPDIKGRERDTMNDAELIEWLGAHSKRMEAIADLLEIQRRMRDSDYNLPGDLRAAVEFCMGAAHRR